MDLTITKQTKNPLLSRNEVEANIIFEGATPKRTDIQKALAKSLKAKDEKMVIVQTIQTVFGHTKAAVVAHAYSDEKAMKDNERANLLEKHSGHGDEPEPAKEEAPAAESTPVEEKKEETPAAETPAAEEKAE